MARRTRRARRRCRTKTVLQAYGPAKKIRICSRPRKKSHWCIFKGKAKVATSCHRTKAMAQKARTRLRKTCKRRVRLKKVAKK